MDFFVSKECVYYCRLPEQEHPRRKKGKLVDAGLSAAAPPPPASIDSAISNGIACL